MKANHRAFTPSRLAITGAAMLLLGSCAGKAPPPPAAAPPPAAVVRRPPPPAPLPPAPPADWRDAPITPGDWRWSMEGGRSVARFGQPGAPALLALVCERDQGHVLLERAGESVSESVPMSLTTTTGTRPLASSPSLSHPGRIVAHIRAQDTVLDAIAFSRGRFVLEVSGLPTLYLPSWPEVTRVVEDCRPPAG